MRLPKSTFTLSIACVIAFAGCDPGSTLQSETRVPTNAADAASEVIPYGNPNRTALTGPASQSGTLLQEQFGSLRAQLIDILEADSPTHEKSDRIEQMVRSQSGSPLAPYLEQFAAHRMLQQLVDEANPSAATIGYYADLLIRNESPDAELVHRALRHLEGEWPSDRLASAASATSARARKWAARVCEACNNEKSRKPAHNPGLILKHGRVLEAADKLDDFVGP